jgi:hypothetical protein
MRYQQKLAPAFQKVVTPATGRPPRPRRADSEYRLDVAVVFTSPAATIAALRHAGSLADRLSARITLMVLQYIPFQFPLESPPVLLDFSEQRFQQIAAASCVETKVQIYLCRDPLETLKGALSARSLVVIGGRRRWWPTREKSMARQLRRAGYEVVFTETE